MSIEHMSHLPLVSMKAFMSLTTCLCRLAMLGRISSNSSREYCKCFK